jgi:hypothetical protein
MKVRVLRRVEEDLGTSVRRTAAFEGIGAPLVWRILSVNSYFTYTTSSGSKPSLLMTTVQGCVLPMDSHKIVVPNILFTDEAGFTRHGIANLDDNPQTSMSGWASFK